MSIPTFFLFVHDYIVHMRKKYFRKAADDIAANKLRHLKFTEQGTEPFIDNAQFAQCIEDMAPHVTTEKIGELHKGLEAYLVQCMHAAHQIAHSNSRKVVTREDITLATKVGKMLHTTHALPTGPGLEVPPLSLVAQNSASTVNT